MCLPRVGEPPCPVAVVARSVESALAGDATIGDGEPVSDGGPTDDGAETADETTAEITEATGATDAPETEES